MSLKKKPAKRARRAVPIRTSYLVTIGCSTGFCEPDPNPLTVHENDYVTFTADGTHVIVKFTTSPFVSGHKQFDIPAGVTTPQETVKPQASKPKHLKYKVTCDDCASVQDPPEMIVE